MARVMAGNKSNLVRILIISTYAAILVSLMNQEMTAARHPSSWDVNNPQHDQSSNYYESSDNIGAVSIQELQDDRPKEDPAAAAGGGGGGGGDSKSAAPTKTRLLQQDDQYDYGYYDFYKKHENIPSPAIGH